ncbi:MAG TPA: hypothetical protein VGX76_00710 [Pirellulales bacterium]|nr:hypothetical protein [Pirellulales bacterium]
MHRFRFNLLTLFAFVVAVAVACAALARPSQLWLAVVSAASLASLFYAVLAAAYGRNARRAFWVGFAVVGWGYVALEWASAAGLPFRLPISLVTGQLESAMHGQSVSANTTTINYTVPTNFFPVYTVPVEPSLASVDTQPDPPMTDTVIVPMPNEAMPSGNEPSTALPPTDGVPVLPGPNGDEPAAVPQPDVSPAANLAVENAVPTGPTDPSINGWITYGTPVAEYATAASDFNAQVWSTSTVATLPVNVVDLEAFRQIAKWIWSPLLGFVGGLVALRLYHRRERQDGQKGATS